MRKLTYKRLLSMLLALVMTFSGLVTLVPLEAKAASEYITNDSVLAETTRSIHVSFDFGRNITQTDASRLAVWLYKQDGTLLTFYDFDLSRRYIDEGTTVGGYSHTFNGLTPDTTYQVKITGSDPDWSGSSDARYVKTPAPGNPVISLDMGWRTATSVRLKGDITLTGTGPGPYAYLSEELKSNALVIVPKTKEPAGNLSVSDPNAVVVFSENWQEHSNAFERYKEYLGLQPDTEYVAQAMLTNIYDNTGYSSKVYFNTFAYPQILIDEMTPRSYDAYIYADITLDTGDAVDSLILYADDNDAQQPKDDPARISGSLVSYDSGTGTAIFHLSGLTVNTAYDVQVLTRSGAGEAWSQKGTFTTLPAPTTATVETQAATNIRNTKALMNATITDMGYSFVLAQGFVYSSVNTNPRRGDADVVEVTVPITSQTAPSAIVALADGLTPDTTYYFQSFVRNNVGTVYGGVLTFTTQDAPEVSTLSSTSGLTTSTVTLYGEVISTGGLSPTLRGFVFSEAGGPTLGGDRVMVSLDSVTNASTGPFDETLSGLSSGTTYYYKVFIHSAQGTTYGTERSFSTASMATILPAVTTNPIVTASITDDSAPVSGSFTTPGGTTVGETGFVYSKFPNPVMGDFNTAFIPLDDTDGSFGTTLTGLDSGRTYYVRAYAENGNGISYGGSVSFTTTSSGEMTIYPPAVITSLTVDSVSADSVTVTMTAPGALGRKIYYSSTDTTPTEGEAGVSSVSYSLGESGQKTIAGLQPNTIYYLRGHTNALGGTEYYGGVLTVTTDEYGLPVVTHGVTPVDTITDSGAKIHYQVNPNGSPVTKTAVVWSKDITVPALGADGVEMNEEDLFYGTTVITSHSLTGLTSNTTYYYAVYAYNAEGWSCSTVGSFTTLAGETPVVAVIDVDPGADSAFVNAQMTQDGTGSNRSYGIGVLVAEVDNATFATPGILVYRAPDVSTAPFTADFTGLSPSTQYYARAFACSIDDVYYYGAVVPFTTQAPPLASVALYGPENISATAADFLISVLDGGGNPIDARGLVYGETALPDLGDNVIVSTGAGTTPGQTSSQLAGLTTGTKYYVRAYATTANGTAYSDQITLTPRETILPPTTTYTVTFEANGGSGTMSPQAFTGGVAQALTANAFSRTGHTFSGWATSSSGGVVYADGQSVTIVGDTTLYAIWNIDAPPALVGTISEMNKTNIGLGDTIYLGGYDGAPLAWRVVSGSIASGSITLLAISKAGDITEFDRDPDGSGPETTSNNYRDSDIREYLNNIFANSLNGVEKSSVVKVRVFDTATGVSIANAVPDEAGDYSYIPSDSSIINWSVGAPGINQYWHSYWLRNPDLINPYRGYYEVAGGGGVINSDLTAEHAPRPAVRINTSNVAAVSEIVADNTGRPWATQADGTNYATAAAGKAYMIGISYPADLYITGVPTTAQTAVGGSLTLSGISPSINDGSASVVYAIYKKSDGSILQYESIAASSLSSVTLNATGITPDNGYAVRMWLQKNTVNHSPALSPFYTFDLTVASTAPQYTVTFESNGGSGTMSPQTFTQGVAQALTANTFSRSGHTFSGWATSPTGVVVYTNGQSVTITASTTLYAMWTSTTPATYTVTFEPNGGSGTMSQQSFTQGVAQALTANAFSRAGHTFSGWATSPTGGVVYTNGQSVTIAANTALYAVWISTVPITYTVTFDANGGTCSTLTTTTDVTGRLSSLPTPTRSGYSFDGWFTAMTGGTQVTTSTVFTSNTTIFAHWTYSGGSGGGGSSYEYYTITASAGIGGSISPSGSFSVREGQDKTFTISPDTGYIVSDVLVDGKSVGAVKTYTFKSVFRTHTIKAEFIEDDKLNPDTGAHIPFIDVSVDDWFVNSVMWAYEKGIMKGTSDTTFGPHDTTTRGMIVTILYRMEGSPATDSLSSFSDVAAGKYYADAVRWAATNGIVSGYGTGLFGPNDSLTREQMVTILYNYAKYKGYDTTTTADLTGFTDASQVSGWASEAMRWAVGSGLIVGKGAGLLDPSGTSTRAEIATVIMRFCEMYLD